MLKLSCLCGQSRVETEQRPEYLHECNCALCRKSGARWAYLNPADVVVTGETRGYTREDKDDPGADLRFCPRCGVTTHFVLTESAVAKHGNVVMGLNVRLVPESELAGVELRFPDGADWPGHGEFAYVLPARVLGA